MTNQDTQTWAARIHNLYCFGSLNDDWDGQGAKSPDLALVGGAVLLAKMLRDTCAPPPDRISPGSSGMVHFEWFKAAANLVITVMTPEEAEIACYNNKGSFSSESFRWGAGLKALPSSLCDTFD